MGYVEVPLPIFYLAVNQALNNDGRRA